MAVLCEFIDLIVPISKIDSVYIGGFEKFKSERIDRFGKTHWHDKFLFRYGAMDHDLIHHYITFWEGLGLVGKEERNGKIYWKDFCEVEAIFDGPTLPCEWIEYNPKTYSVHMKGTEPGEIAGPVRKGFNHSIT